jgi:hypothetical protein
VYNYFAPLTGKNQLSITAHNVTACFLGASQKTMLKWLKKYEEVIDGEELRLYWHRMMESKDGREHRQQFFSEVVEQSHEASHYHLLSFSFEILVSFPSVISRHLDGGNFLSEFQI